MTRLSKRKIAIATAVAALLLVAWVKRSWDRHYHYYNVDIYRSAAVAELIVARITNRNAHDLYVPAVPIVGLGAKYCQPDELLEKNKESRRTCKIVDSTDSKKHCPSYIFLEHCVVLRTSKDLFDLDDVRNAILEISANPCRYHLRPNAGIGLGRVEVHNLDRSWRLLECAKNKKTNDIKVILEIYSHSTMRSVEIKK